MTDQTDLTTLTDRLVEYEREWLWNEATDDKLAGYGFHMDQMLYRLPVDGQTRDMQASIESMIADLHALLARAESAGAAHAALTAGIEALAGNYEVRANHAPEPRAQWSDIARDLRALLAESTGAGR